MDIKQSIFIRTTLVVDLHDGDVDLFHFCSHLQFYLSSPQLHHITP